MLLKNFSYGDIWKEVPLKNESDKHGRSRENIEDYTTNSAFVSYVKENGYRFYLDYDLHGFAYTLIDRKEIVVNANYSNEVIASFIQHELGHLMLFDVNQFTTVRKDTLRSIISKVIYTPENLIKFGIQKLLYIENVIQDIIIETLSNGRCVCRTTLTNYGVNISVKHLNELEDSAAIAKEVCKNLLKEEEDIPELDENLKEIIESMLKNLKGDIQEIEREIEKTKNSNSFRYQSETRRNNESRKIRKQLDNINRKLDRKYSERLDKIRKTLEKQLREVNSEKRLKEDNKKDDENLQKAVDKLQKALENDEEILERLKEALKEASDPEPQGSGQGENPSESHSEVSKELHKNTTDRDSEDNSGTGGHSFDCGLPNPLTIERSDSAKNESNLVRLSSKPTVKKIHIQEDDAENVLSNRIKTPESEYTYFKSNKKEFDQTDMLKGKRKLRVSGINVLIGLDVSGSMISEWGVMFTELSELVKSFKETLEIENIVYFTYNQRLQAFSKDLNDLDIRAGGGNAFGYVYQDIMQSIPIMQRNEIILVTDCGDNLGFSLKGNCIAERNGMEVENHISIIDTENAGFYAKDGFNEDDWTLCRYDDPKIHEIIKTNIENLIDK